MNQMNELEMQPKTRSRAAAFRAKARTVLKGRWGIAILAMLLAGLLGAFTTGGGIPDVDEWKVDFDGAKKLVNEWVAWGKGFESTGGLLRGLWNRGTEWVRASQTHLFATILSGFAVIWGILYPLLLGSPIAVGYRRFGLHLLDGGDARIGDLFGSFRQGYGKTVGMRFLVGLCQALCGLVSLAGLGLIAWSYLRFFYGETTSAVLTYLGIVGGTLIALAAGFYAILLSFRFFLCPFLLAEYPQFTPAQVLGHSKNLMKGNKWRLFCLYCSFIGWYLLGTVTCGIAFFWVIPYVHTAEAAFYDEISERSRTGNMEFPSLDPNDYQ